MKRKQPIIPKYFVRDWRRVLIGWFDSPKEAEDFIKRNDPEGLKKFEYGPSA
jgi:hypothetical protein